MIIPPIDAKILHDVEKADQLEWLETNGLGGFASQTVIGTHTRRYHGLLFASLAPPAQRVLLLSAVLETLVIDGTRHELSTHHYEDATAPTGHTTMQSFALEPFPLWKFSVGNVVLKKTVFMSHGKNEVVVLYRILKNTDRAAIRLELKPLIAGRDMHVLKRENAECRCSVEEKKGYLKINTYDDVPEFYLSHNAALFEHGGVWYKNFYLQEEEARGYDSREDLYCIGTLQFTLGKNSLAFLVGQTKRSTCSALSVQKQEQAEKERRTKNEMKSRNSFVKALLHAADQFIVKRGRTGKSIVAGYHWFTDWGRDAMISIPGLLLTRGFHDDAKKIVKTYLQHLNQGMIPNRFPERDLEPEYNAVDATLWVFQAVRLILQKTGDTRFLLSIFPKLQEIIRWYEKGTRHGIHIDIEDKLLSAGEDGFALTWMDAVTDREVVTPRQGKPVEVNALWYNALCCMTEFALLLKRDAIAAEMRSKAKEVRSNFRAAFWNAEENCLYDCIAKDGTPIDELRPNQIFAISLRSDLLTNEQQQSVLATVTKHLLTPMGLRSLAPSDAKYVETYEGDQYQRDAAYHQGTVWGWLIGPYIDAYINVHGKNSKTKKHTCGLLAGFKLHMSHAGLGQLSEIFDAKPPHAPRGCIAQAWTVAEVLRVLDTL